MDSKALTKIQSVALIAVIVVAAVGGATAYVLWSGPAQSTETIKIGLLADLPFNQDDWQAAVLAAEQVNAEGGVLGRNFTIVYQDDDYLSSSGDMAVSINALTKLITVDKADFVVAKGGFLSSVFQDICSEHKKILLTIGANADELSQRVLDNYDKYKYYFSMNPNATSARDGCLDSLLTLRNYTGLNKVAYLDQDASAFKDFRVSLMESLSEHGFDVVYQNSATWQVTDFTSYFAAIEASGAEILFENLYLGVCVSFVKEWYDRQSPFVLWGTMGLTGNTNFWELTEGKCEYASTTGLPTIAGYPLTNQTVPFRDAYLQRWNVETFSDGTLAYDAIRFILPEAIRRAGSTETEAVIKALEKTDVETSTARHFVFTSSHDVFIGEAGPNIPSADYMLVCLFQWQNGVQVPVYPKEIMEEAGATYKYPPWQGPWTNKQIP